MTQFHWADYLVFVIMLVVSIMTGIYFAYTDRKKHSVEEFLMAGRKMKTLPVAFSLFVSWMSGISFIGDPVECYKYGFIYILLVAGYAIGTALSAYFAPKFHELKILSAFEFLEIRYSRGLRLVSSAMLIFQLTIWQGIATYAPALALSQASGIPVWASNVLIGLVCTFYTAVGGMKAVIWTDTIQMAVMLAGQIAIVVQGSLRMGGISEVFRVAQEGGRLNFKESVTDFNPLSRAALWSFFIGGITRVFCVFISNQLQIQRYCTVPTAKDARNAVLLVVPMFCVMSTLIALGGLIMYALYSDCDPLLSGQVERRDQMVAYLVIDLLGFMPGIPGLFLATVFSASLSSLSSGMNAIAAMLLADFIQPLYRHFTGSAMGATRASVVAKWLAVFSGLTVVLSSFLPMALGSTVFAMTSITEGAVVGPSSGVFFLAIMFPQVKALFVHVAYAVSLVLCLVVAVLGQILPKRGPWEELPLSTEGCPLVNTSIYSNGSWQGEMMVLSARKMEASFNTSAEIVAEQEPPFSFADIHQINPLLYLPLGFVTVLSVAGFLQSITVCMDLVRGVNEDDDVSDSQAGDAGVLEKDPMLKLTQPLTEPPAVWSTNGLTENNVNSKIGSPETLELMKC